MKPLLLKVPYGIEHSFGVRKETAPNINDRWHYHPEIEIVHFYRGYGTQFIGDHISRFGPGDIALVGSNLPHFWKFDDLFYHHDGQGPYATVIHFFEHFLGERFLHLPEARHVRALLERAKRGLLIRGSDAEKIGDLIEDTYQSQGLYKILSLLSCLIEFSACDDIVTLSSLGFKYDFHELENKRINAIYNYTFSNFQKKIKLDDVSAIAGMITNSFCRYFKHRTGKTYSDFLTEIRIAYACKLLISNQMSVKQICFESGFNNFSCFHEYFKKATGKTPMGYQMEYEKGLAL